MTPLRNGMVMISESSRAMLASADKAGGERELL